MKIKSIFIEPFQGKYTCGYMYHNGYRYVKMYMYSVYNNHYKYVSDYTYAKTMTYKTACKHADTITKQLECMIV